MIHPNFSSSSFSLNYLERLGIDVKEKMFVGKRRANEVTEIESSLIIWDEVFSIDFDKVDKVL